MGTAGQSITLANSIIGVGILAMPFCFQQCGVLLATLILLFMGLVSRLCCYFLLKSALLARRRNFEFLAFHVFGPAGKLAVEIGIIGFLMGTCIAYFVVVGDLGPQIVAKLFNINQSDILRTSIMVLVSLLCVLPLGLLRNVDSLSNVSAATIGFYFCLVMKVIAEAASQLLTGEWQVHMELWKPSGVLQCVPIFSMALFCQTQLFELFESLPTLSLEKMNLVTKNAINICTGVYFTLGVFGYVAFCSQQISGNILMSLSPTMASDVIKLGFVMSLAFSFPLIIFPCRASLYSLLYKKVHSTHHDHIINHSIPESSFRCITVAIIAVTLFISLLIPNIELVLGLVGSTIGVMVCIVFPCACFINVTFKNTNERLLAKGVLVLGLIIMVLGTYANLQAAESQKDKYDERFITPEKIDKMVEEFFEKMDKSDDGEMVKPIDKNDVKEDDTVIKDSMVLPPNPVPPESNEKLADKEPPKHENFKVLDEPNHDKVSETHPKNLKKINDVKLTNGDSNKIDMEKPKDKEKTEVNEEKKEIEKKQQKLIETIKQHGEEQKELLKEQKVILDEILKTKKEMAQKNEADSNEAKKIAVESIKKIADMAIQSLAGVSEKPIKVENSNDVGKLADEAVQEIAKKAVETIAAIKEINEKVEEKQAPNFAPSASQNIQQVPKAQDVPQNILSPIQNIPQPASIITQNGQNILQPAQNVPQPAQSIPQSAQNAPQPVQSISQSAQNAPQVQSILQSAQSAPQPALIQPELVQNVQQPAQKIQPQNVPPENAQQPAQNIQQPQKDQNVQQPILNVQQSQNLLPPAQNVPKQAQNVQQSAQSAQNIQQQNAQQAAQSAQNIHQQNAQQAAQSAQNIHQQNAQQAAQSAQNIQQQNAQQAAQSAQIAQQQQNVQQSAQNVEQAAHNMPAVAPQVQNLPVPAQVVQQPAQNIQPVPNLAQPNQNAPQSIQNGQKSAQNEQLPPQAAHTQQIPNAQPLNNALPANNQPNVAQFVSNNVANQPPQQNLQAHNNEKKEHSHSPDEPKSYQQGEDAQKQDGSNNIIQPNAQNNQNEKLPAVDDSKLNYKVNGAIDNGKPRQKREVVDCTEKSTLKPEDKEICERLINVPQYKVNDKVEFPKVDLSDVDLPRSLPLDANMIHIGRSLKSYDDKENR